MKDFLFLPGGVLNAGCAICDVGWRFLWHQCWIQVKEAPLSVRSKALLLCVVVGPPASLPSLCSLSFLRQDVMLSFFVPENELRRLSREVKTCHRFAACIEAPFRTLSFISPFVRRV